MTSPVISNDLHVISGASGNAGSIIANDLLLKGKKVRVVGRDAGIGKLDLQDKQFPYDQVEQILRQMGIPPKGAALYLEMYKAINTGVLIPLEPRSPENIQRALILISIFQHRLTSTTLHRFAFC
ncbi:hypothetical protein [Granulicella mallensis]|uniref:Uncharacterized protein n=1 Tax=Granulicella mallensis (strain ATCC BAA-1857 / DSM 23137 / MP5ACTX8) TaxID=682795 RepID=G8P0N3_GRAMM|nr:hypothetical protein [Granulicella mallensis]AEU34641.1 hypothetical protein AciX8_0284 [Granulicella mallensis MP5ACTX8]